MTRNQRILTAVLALQIVLVLFAKMPFSGKSAGSSSSPLIPSWDEMQPTRILLGDDDGVSLRRQDGRWQVDDLDGFPADDRKIESLLERIGSAEVRRPLVRSARYHESFNLVEQDAEGRLRIWAADDEEPRVDLLFGNTPNFGSIHVRRTNEDAVFEVRDLAAYDVAGPAENWIEKDWIDVDTTNIVGLTIRNAIGDFTVIREDDGWSVNEPALYAGQVVGDDLISDLLSDICALRIAEVAGHRDETTHGFAAVGVQAELRFRADDMDEVSTIVLEIGLPVEGNDTSRYVGRSGSAFAGIAWESGLSSLLDADLSAMMGD